MFLRSFFIFLKKSATFLKLKGICTLRRIMLPRKKDALTDAVYISMISYILLEIMREI